MLPKHAGKHPRSTLACRELSGQNQHELPSFPVTWAFAPCDSYGVIFDDDGDIARQPTLPPALPPPTGVTSFDAATGSGGAPAPAAEALAPAAAQPQAGDFTGAATLGHTQEPLIADAARQLACGFGHVGTNAQVCAAPRGSFACPSFFDCSFRISVSAYIMI